MMRVQAQSVGKRFKRNWVFRNLDFNIENGNCCVFLGSNGSGKSTLAQLVMGYSSPSEGHLEFSIGNQPIPREDIGLKTSFCAPYSNLYEQLNLKEVVDYHLQFRSFHDGLSAAKLIDLAYLEGHEDKQIQHFSSGMKQRLKLALTICTQSELLILDEPCSNLDSQAIVWYRSLLEEHRKKRTLVIATNDLDNEVVNHDLIVNLSLDK